MTAVWIRVRSELRARWRAWLGLALLVGLAGGVSIAAATGARRTDTAYPRLARAQRAPDVVTGGATGSEDEFVAGLHELAKLPQVRRARITTSLPDVQIRTMSGRLLRFPQLDARIAPDEPAPTKIVAGRDLKPARADETTLSFAARSRDLDLGSVLDIRFGDTDTVARLRVVGIHAAIGEFPSVNGVAFPGLRLSSAFGRTYRSVIESDLPSNRLSEDFYLKHGAADVAAFRAEADKRGIKVELPLVTSEHISGVRKTMRFESSALWLLAALAGLASTVLIGQLLARQAFLEALDFPVLRALGLSRRQLLVIGLIRAAVIGAAGALIAVVLGFVGSALTPIGLARIAEPDPGAVVDRIVAIAGAGTVLLLVIAVSAWPARRAARGAAAGADIKASSIVPAAARAAAPISAVIGLRFALSPGRGSSALPARSAALAAIVGIGALAMALTFVASLHRLIDEPERTGFRWDALVYGEDPDGTVTRLEADRTVAAVAKGATVSMKIGDSFGLVFATSPGSGLGPVIVEGRAPSGPDEVALGTKSMRDQHLRIGDRIALSLTAAGTSGGGRGSAVMRITGRAVVPSVFFEPHEPGEGAALTPEGLARIDPAHTQQEAVLVRFRPGVDLDVTSQKLEEFGFVARRQAVGRIAALESVTTVPLVLAALLSVTALAAMIHTLISTTRRRRRDLAILKTIGFVRRQVVSTIAWQSAAIVVLALILGIPGGIAAGRWGWRLFADQIAVVPSSDVPGGQVAALIPAALALAVLVSLLPGRAAARTRPSVTLRTE